MKRSTKIILILAAVLLLSGICMVSAAFIMTGGDILEYETDEAYEKIEEVYEKGEISALTFSGSSQDVILRPSTDGKFRVIRYESEEVAFLSQKLYYVLDGEKSVHLKITEKNSYQQSVFKLQLNPDVRKIIIEIPETQENITIQTKSGDISFGELSVNGELALESVSGTVTAATVTADTLRLSTTSGDIRLTDADAISLSCTAISGDILLNNVSTKEASSLEAVSGDVSCIAYTADAHFTVTTTSGDIETADTMLVSADFSSTSGDIDLRLLLNPNQQTYLGWKTVSGTVRHVGKPTLPKNGITDSALTSMPTNSREMEAIKKTTISVNTVSGDILIDFDTAD